MIRLWWEQAEGHTLKTRLTRRNITVTALSASTLTFSTAPGARLLIAADCTAYAYAAFHERFIKGHITLVGCPKLDGVDYSEKLTEIIRENNIQSVTVTVDGRLKED